MPHLHSYDCCGGRSGGGRGCRAYRCWQRPVPTRLEGKAAFGDWRLDKPGTRRLIRPQDLPAADQAGSATDFLYPVRRSEQQKPAVPTGFEVNLFASGLSHQRLIRVAPNGDVFAAESEAGRVRVLRPNRGQPASASVFADGLARTVRHRLLSARPRSGVGLCRQHRLRRPLSPIAAATSRRAAPAETVVPQLPTGGSTPHARRRVLARRHARCSSRSAPPPTSARPWESSSARNCRPGNRDACRSAPPGATRPTAPPCSRSIRRARTAASSRPASATASAWRSHPASGELWCSINERDGLGDDCRPTTSRACAKARSTAGPGTTSAPTRIRATAASGRT